ncbi:ABC transporter permease [Pseudomonas syringae pv. actinidifoliorum]|nr:ABC transporter permease [Pseudomonas syringae pv. actinidifoliorum]
MLTDQKIPLGEYIAAFVDWLTANGADYFDAIASTLEMMIHGVTFALTWFNPFVLIGLIAALAHFIQRKWGLTVFVILSFLLILNLHYWQETMETLAQVLFATLVCVVIGVPLGMFAGMYPDHPLSRLMMAASIVGFSLPAFWVALMMIMLFSITLGWLPASGRGETREWLGVQWSWLTLDGLQHLLLPALNLALFKISLVLRLTRAGVREVLPQEFVKFARAKGLSPMRVMCMHVMRNTMIPVVTVLAMELGSTIAYAVVTESIFAWPGAGKLILDSINMLDRPVVVAYLMVVVVIFVVLNLIVDGLYYLLDPRVRIEASR